MRRLLLPLALLSAATFAPAASAATATVGNSCKWSIDDVHRDLDITLGGAAAPNPVGPGGSVALGSPTAASRLPDYLAQTGYDLGLLVEGRNDIPATVWVATSAGGVNKVVSTTLSTTTTITVDAAKNYVSSTPIEVSVPLPGTTWTAPASGALAFAQAAPGSLPLLPIGPQGRDRQPAGSIVIQAALSNATRVALDCAPGASIRGGTYTPAASWKPFETVPVQVDSPAPPPPVQPPGTATPAVLEPTIRSTRLRSADRSTLPVVVACPAGTGACFGNVEVRTRSKHRIGSRKPAFVLVARGDYSVPAGRTRTVELDLSTSGRSLLRRKRSFAVGVKLLPRESPKVAVATKSLTLRR